MSSNEGPLQEPETGGVSEADLFRRERAQFALAERAANFGYWRHDIATQTSAWSPGMYRLLGITPDERKPDAEWLLATMIDEDRAKVECAIDASSTTRASFYYRTHCKESFGPRTFLIGENDRAVDFVRQGPP